jgi:hypothetical protein
MQDVQASQGSVRKRFAAWIKNVDFFGQTVNLTWNGEDRFKTTFGASVTIVLIAVLLAFTVFKALDLFKKNNPTVSKTTILRNPDLDSLSYRP